METKEMVPKLRFTGFIECWTQSKLNELNNKQIKWSITGGPFGSDLKSEDYTESGVRIIQLQNIGDGFFNDSNKIYTTEIKADQLIACNIYPGEIILSKMGDPVARACIIPSGQERYLMSSDGIRFVNDPLTTDRTFLYFYINSSYFRRQAISVSTGSTRKRIGLTDLKEIHVNLPSLQEQQKIASFLSSVDEKISQLEKKKTLLETYKRGIMQKIFSQELRFKDENGDEFPEWEENELGNISKIFGRIGFRGYTKNDIVKKGEGAITISPSDIINNKISYENCTYISWHKYDESPEIQIFNNDILIVKTASIGKITIIKNLEEKATINPQFVVLKKVSANNDFLYYLLDTKGFNKQIRKIAAGGVLKTISQEHLSRITLILPCSREQQKIASFLSIIDKKIEIISTQLEKTREFKKGLLQQMFV